ncbi:hypothetical protein [Alicyclobacillus ferrooxydans]|uniref:Uncharacterized protein n=1 Tax=Alicyclobacillus ferrooxydans TaxID=471514 RepID=A0A0N8PPA2_9BACL|nr:hypothetical protein [Alicyclobacillus ferrooxydans]KPV43757.1 hypothetical protein AN477_10200 [Alicyclobacillus ferrooxydans]
MKFTKHTAAMTMVAMTVTMSCSLTVHPIDAVIPSDTSAVGTGLMKLDEILLMTPLWRNISLQFTVDFHPQGTSVNVP